MASKLGMGVIAVVALGITLPEPETDPVKPSQTTATRTVFVDVEACRDAWRKTHPVPEEILQTAKSLRRLDLELETGNETGADVDLPEMTEEKKVELLVAERDIQRWRTMDDREFINSFRDTLKQICEERKIDLVLQKKSDPKVHEMFCGIKLPNLSTHSVLYASERIDVTDLVIERWKQAE